MVSTPLTCEVKMRKFLNRLDMDEIEGVLLLAPFTVALVTVIVDLLTR